jgi:hypothetical protein
MVSLTDSSPQPLNFMFFAQGLNSHLTLIFVLLSVTDLPRIAFLLCTFLSFIGMLNAFNSLFGVRMSCHLTVVAPCWLANVAHQLSQSELVYQEALGGKERQDKYMLFATSHACQFPPFS